MEKKSSTFGFMAYFLYICNMTRIWKQIKSHPQYEVSNQGEVRHGDRILKPYNNSKGYLYVKLGKEEKQLRVNRLVAEAFIPNPDNKPVVNHKDSNTFNNIATNLEWATHTENSNNPSTKEICKHNRKKCGTPLQILQLNDDGNIIGYYKTVREVIEKFGVDKSDLSKCCRGKLKRVGGYKWVYLEDWLADWLYEYQLEYEKRAA